jgi:radical SAM-linked protein
MRLRIVFSKSGALRYAGHLDLQTTWERTVRRAGLPLAYTHGFHPGPRIQIASALPLGFIGRAEIVDIWLDEPGVPVDRPYADILQSAAPPGLTIVTVEQVDQAGPALQTQVASAEYEVTLLDPADAEDLERRITAMLKLESLVRERRGKEYNLRPLIEALSLATGPSPDGGGAGLKVFMRLAAHAGATARPEAVLEVLGIPFEATRIERTRLILETGME